MIVTAPLTTARLRGCLSEVIDKRWLYNYLTK